MRFVRAGVIAAFLRNFQGLRMQKRFLECGRIVATHGVRGDVRAQHWCDSAEFLCGFSVLYTDGGARRLEVESARVHKNMPLLKFTGVDTIDAALPLRGKTLFLDRDDAPPLPDGQFYIQDLLGLAVTDADSGAVYGTLTDILATGANDVYEITRPDGQKLYAPAIPDVVIARDIAAGVIRIRPLEGLFT